MNEFELILLKNLTHVPEFFGKAMPILKVKHFQDQGSKELFKLVKDYYGEYSRIPELTELVAMVKNVPNSGTREEIVKTLREVAKHSEIKNVKFLLDETVKFVKDSLYLEALQIGSEGLMEKNDSKKLQAQEILDERAKVTLDTDLGLDFDDIDTMISYYSERMVGVRTQHQELNRRLGPGFLPKTLSLILAASGIGKSLLMTDLISGMIKQGKNILLVSMEMQDREIMKRVHANAMDLPINSLIDLSKTPGELKKLHRDPLTKEEVISAYNRMKMSGKCGKLFVKEYPAGTFTAMMLENLVKSYEIEKGIKFDVVFLDYIGIMASDRVSPSAGLYSYVKSIAEEVRGVAQKLEIPIVSASQLNRGAMGSNFMQAGNENVADSVGSLQTADFMLFLLQDEEMKSRGEIVLKCTKNRFSGRTDTWMMNIDYEHMRFSDMISEDSVEAVLLKEEGKLDEDFGILTTEKLQKADEFASKEVREILAESAKQLHSEKKKDELNSELDEIYKELGI